MVSLIASNVIVADWSTLTELMSASLTATSTSMLPMSEMVIDEPELLPPVDEAEPPEDAAPPDVACPTSPSRGGRGPGVDVGTDRDGQDRDDPVDRRGHDRIVGRTTASLYDCSDDV